MIDTIVYIPTILAYTFIGLLICILCFIVIYVSHKVYITIYDNLHIPILSSSELDNTVKSDEQDQCQFKAHLRPSIISGESATSRKLKTVLEVSVLPEERHLAYIAFKTKQELLDFTSIKTPQSPKPTELPALTTAAARNSNIFVKYYLSLSDLPLASDFPMQLRCHNKTPSSCAPSLAEPAQESSSPSISRIALPQNSSPLDLDIPTLMDEMLQSLTPSNRSVSRSSLTYIERNREIQLNRNPSKQHRSPEDDPQQQ